MKWRAGRSYLTWSADAVVARALQCSRCPVIFPNKYVQRVDDRKSVSDGEQVQGVRRRPRTRCTSLQHKLSLNSASWPVMMSPNVRAGDFHTTALTAAATCKQV